MFVGISATGGASGVWAMLLADVKASMAKAARPARCVPLKLNFDVMNALDEAVGFF
jgi:hypothetical protein